MLNSTHKKEQKQKKNCHKFGKTMEKLRGRTDANLVRSKKDITWTYKPSYL